MNENDPAKQIIQRALRQTLLDMAALVFICRNIQVLLPFFEGLEASVLCLPSSVLIH